MREVSITNQSDLCRTFTRSAPQQAHKQSVLRPISEYSDSLLLDNRVEFAICSRERRDDPRRYRRSLSRRKKNFPGAPWPKQKKKGQIKLSVFFKCFSFSAASGETINVTKEKTIFIHVSHCLVILNKKKVLLFFPA